MRSPRSRWMAGARFCVAALTLASSPAVAQTVRIELISPLATDPQITGWTANHAVAYSTDLPPAQRQGKLCLFLHGLGGTGAGAQELLRTAARAGYHAVGLTYANDWAPITLCSNDSACAERVRREIVEGVDHSPLITVTRPNSVENRLLRLLDTLQSLHPDENWAQFKNADQIRWDRVALWGHSQGGGNASIIAKDHVVDRLCTSAPAADGGPGAPAVWWASHSTPASATFGFCHAQDQLIAKTTFWTAWGMAAFGPARDVATTAAPYGATHMLSTSLAPAIAGQFHNSVVIDNVTPRNSDGTPAYLPVWQYMLTTPTTPGGGSGPTWNDVPFATVQTSTGPVTLLMDIYAATTGDGPRPLLIWIHGGGWQSGDQNQTPASALALRERGISVASIHYRLSAQAVFPAQVHDCKGAVRFLRAHAAEFNLDPARFAVWGSSAGGHLAALVAASGNNPALEGDTAGNLEQPSTVLAGVSYFGPTDILQMQSDCTAQVDGCSFNHDDASSPESALLGVNQPGQGLAWLRANLANPAEPFPTLAARATDANPIHSIDPADPVMFIAHGDADRTVPFNQSVRLLDALHAAGVQATFTPSPGAGHGSLGSAIDAAARDFVTATLFGTLACNSADITAVGGTDLAPTLPDAQITVDDLLAFVNAFSSAGGCSSTTGARCGLADLTGLGGPPEGPDGQLTVDDLITFVNAYSEGCP